MDKLSKKIKFGVDFSTLFVKNLIYRYKSRLTRKKIRAKINQPKCKCGHVFNVSWPVVYRLISCPKCGRSYWYERDLKMNYTWEKLGRHNMRKFERKLEDYGRELI